MMKSNQIAQDLLTRAEVYRDTEHKLEEAVFLVAAHLLDPQLVSALQAATTADCADMPGLALQLVSRALDGREKDPHQRERLLIVRDGIEAVGAG